MATALYSASAQNFINNWVIPAGQHLEKAPRFIGNITSYVAESVAGGYGSLAQKAQGGALEGFTNGVGTVFRTINDGISYGYGAITSASVCDVIAKGFFSLPVPVVLIASGMMPYLGYIAPTVLALGIQALPFIPPATPVIGAVAGFIGATNFIPLVLTGIADGSIIGLAFSGARRIAGFGPVARNEDNENSAYAMAAGIAELSFAILGVGICMGYVPVPAAITALRG